MTILVKQANKLNNSLEAGDVQGQLSGLPLIDRFVNGLRGLSTMFGVFPVRRPCLVDDSNNTVVSAIKPDVVLLS